MKGHDRINVTDEMRCFTFTGLYKDFDRLKRGSRQGDIMGFLENLVDEPFACFQCRYCSKKRDTDITDLSIGRKITVHVQCLSMYTQIHIT